VRLEVGSLADMTILDYQSPTALTTQNLAWHLVFGMTSGSVESVMVNGKFVMRDRRFPFDSQGLYQQARVACEKLWARLRSV
jgi:cytosine/adenosine deaminase-related metal-dependent hydrolase